ncbi:MAG TPA: nucleoside triphosphate pyrophosphohydrolase [Nitrospinota bacterium]|nr:nucleoside triphosphate pyrophosphohydrolase [Nitrospinota bacterium]|tara:strand:+ start:2579 stop:3355 length:777 start_codon:yes stop_codon:yes gene_type:complete
MSKSFDRLVSIMGMLRGKEGCPWDRVQTHKTLKPYLIEEVYEVLETIDSNNSQEMCNELGDLMLQIVFHAQLATEKNKFNIDEVCERVCEKLIHRHPHVFANTRADTPEKVLANWEKVKRLEKTNKGKSVLNGVPTSMPGLLRAWRLQNKASSIGFDWNKTDETFDKLLEEMGELIEAYSRRDSNAIEMELGDLLFSLVNVARFLKTNPEEALRKSTNKFISRFEYMEKAVADSGREIDKISFKEMGELWDMAKKDGL